MGGQEYLPNTWPEPVHRYRDHRGDNAAYDHYNQHILQPFRHIHFRSSRLASLALPIMPEAHDASMSKAHLLLHSALVLGVPALNPLESLPTGFHL
jgi:hypothetical protein